MENDATQSEAVEGQVDDNAEEVKQDGINFESQSELDSFMDKRVSKAIETARGKWEEEAKAREDKAKQLAKMTEAERTKAEQAEREKTLTEREKSLQMREYSIQAKSTLAEAGLPNTDELTDLVLSEDVEKTNNNINYLKAVIADAVKSKVDELSKQSTPKDTGSFGSVTGRSFMELAEKNRVIK